MNYKFFIAFSISYLALPFVIFCLSFLRWYWGVPVSLLTIWMCWQYVKGISMTVPQMKWPSLANWIIFLFSALLLFFDGVGGFWSQNPDFLMKNTILRDLSSQSWPLYYDLSGQPVETQAKIGSDQVAFVYYLFYYLPAGVIGRLFGDLASRIALLIWSAAGLTLVIDGILLVLKKYTIGYRKLLFVLLLFAVWGGLDVLGDAMLHPDQMKPGRFLFSTMEMWNNDEEYFWLGYQGFVGGMVWAFNQFIPIWLVVVLVMLRQDSRYMAFVSSFLLLYSPWGIIGWAPVVLYVFFYANRSWQKIKESLTLSDSVFPILMLVIVGSYYMSKKGEGMEQGFCWDFIPMESFVWKYLLFLIVEVGVYVWVTRQFLYKNPWLQIAMIMLVLLPFYKLNYSNDLLMRGSAPAILILFIFWVKWVLLNWRMKRTFIVVIMCASSVAQLQSYCGKMVNHFVRGYDYILNDIPSFAYIKEPLSYYDAGLCDRQFFAHQYEDTFFWKYLAKR